MTIKPDPVIRHLRQFLHKYRIDICLLEGEERTSKKNLSILFFGGGITKTYISELVFTKNPREINLGRRWTWNMAPVLKDTSADIVIRSDVGKQRFQRLLPQGAFFIPNWLHGEIMFSNARTKMKTSGHLKSDLRRIRKNNLDFEITQSSCRFDDFYHNMHVPYISKAYGSLAMIMSYDKMKSLEQKSELLLVKHNGQYLAGQILVYENNRVRCWSIGVRDGNYDYVKMGAQAALYFYEIDYLSNKGYAAMNVGASRPFLQDGVLRFKNKWGMTVTGSSKEGLLLKPLRRSAGTMSFLQNNPFIHIFQDSCAGVAFASNNQRHNDDFYLDLYAKHWQPGLSIFHIYADKIPDHMPGQDIDIKPVASLFDSV